MNNKTSGCPKLLRGLLIAIAGPHLAGCANNIGREAAESPPITRIESSTPVRQWPVKDPYIVNNGGKIQVIPDERYEPRPSKK